MTIQERIEDIIALQQDQCWYITKHPLEFKDLLFASKIVEDFQLEDNALNFEDFFNTKADEYGISRNHRMTNNCYYLGLLEKKGTQYKDAILTPIYFAIKEKYNNDFSNINLNDSLIINQIEKVFISNSVDREFQGVRSDYKIHPAFFLSKILIILGEVTSEYSITLDEFYLIIGTSKKYSDYLSSVSLIIEYRNNPQLFSQNVIGKFTNNRVHLLLENLPYLSRNGSNIELVEEFIETIKSKLYFYESNNSEDLFTDDYLHSIKNISSNTSQVDTNQKIYFGAPGTGKSYKVEKLTSDLPEEQVERIIFHPEYDYASFIGGYKPTMVTVDGKEEIQYKFVPQAFTNVYVKAHNNPAKDYYLIIEEINRGNCAEIFGDIFQLLDRNSDYRISSSKELKEYLEGSLTDSGIENGKMILPSNLHILATMNTSDQSLFPMDSAFKRRWDWEYIPINYEPFYEEEDSKEENKSFNYFVEFTDKSTFKWIDFIKKVNSKIKSNDGLGMDKCIGNYFVKPIDDKITFSQFLNKAIFYLWNDVFKDETENDSIFKNKTTYEDFFPLKEGELLMMKILKDLEVEIIENNISNSEEE